MSIEGGDLLPLFVWTSPAFPVGAFAYSHGLEWAVERGATSDANDLQGWLHDLLLHGAPRNDAIIVAAAWRAFGGSAVADVAVLNDLAMALAGSRERHLETTQQGNAFLLAAAAAWPCPTLGRLRAAIDGDVAYPVAFGAAAAGHSIELKSVLEAFVLGVIANLVSAAVRLGVVGQTDGQRVVAALAAPIRALAAAAAKADLDDLGGAAFGSDIASLRHETQYCRLFRS